MHLLRQFLRLTIDLPCHMMTFNFALAEVLRPIYVLLLPFCIDRSIIMLLSLSKGICGNFELCTRQEATKQFSFLIKANPIDLVLTLVTCFTTFGLVPLFFAPSITGLAVRYRSC